MANELERLAEADGAMFIRTPTGVRWRKPRKTAPYYEPRCVEGTYGLPGINLRWPASKRIPPSSNAGSQTQAEEETFYDS
jgi:hypothetical protein